MKFDVDKYVDVLFDNQNKGAVKEQQGLYSKQDYFGLLKPVMELIANHKDYSVSELRTLLYNQSGIDEEVKSFIYKKEMVPGLVFSYGTKNFKETVVVGNRQEVVLDKSGVLVPAIEKMTEDTIFDLASVTKLFTSLSILKLVQEGLVDLNRMVTDYAPEFKNLSDITILDLMSFNVALDTDIKLEKLGSKEEAIDMLFNIKASREEVKRPYTDMGAMILKYVIEHVSSENYYTFIDNNILNKLGLNDTHVVVPERKLYRVANTNYACKFYKDGNVGMTTNAPKGIAYDPKAQIMGQSSGDLSGHAGLFSTAKDMTGIAKGMIDGGIVNDKFIEMMAKNGTGKAYIEDEKQKYIQYLGLLCYSKNPILADSELFHALSGRSLASAGWTGTQVTVDPVNELFFFLGGNRSHNRAIFIDPSKKDQVEIDENGKKTIILPDGSSKIDATRFAWDRDVIVHKSIMLSIQYKMLEDALNYTKEDSKVDENVRHI